MSHSLAVTVGRLQLKNPVIAGSAEHLIEMDGVRAAIRAGAGAVVVKSTNESQPARQQLQQAEYMALDSNWRRVPWGRDTPADAFVACRSGLTPRSFADWLRETVILDREAKPQGCVVVASVILADLDAAVGMAREIEAAGLRALELNIGTPYASQAVKGAVSTELDPARISMIVGAVRAATALPLWIKITGQSERVPDLAAAAFDAGADAVVMAGRLLGMIPDLDTFEPMLGTSLGVGGHWNVPLTCHWLALSRARVGAGKSLVGTNGAQSGADVARMMLAGASAVEMSTAVMMRGFDVLSRAVAELDAYCKAKDIGAAALIGRAADARKRFADMPTLQDNWRNYIPK